VNSRQPKQIIFMLLAIFGAGLIFVESSQGQLRMPFKRQSKTERASQNLTVKDGPWLIMCTSFTGDDAEQKARLLANELQKQRLTTYLYRQTFDHSLSTTGVGWQVPKSVRPLANSVGEIPKDIKLNNPEPELVKMKTANASKVHEVAVLVGDFPTADDNKAQKVLKRIKTMNVSSLGSPNPGATKAQKNARTLERSKGGPLRTAFLLPNPMLPDEYFRREQVDEFIVKINRNDSIKNSLLDCPGIYSVRIATFRGNSTIDPEKIINGANELENLKRAGKSLSDTGLNKAEENAHKLTTHLRAKGVEAYEFHDRQESIVCIGSFDWVTRESHGSVMNNPEIVRIVNSCQPESRTVLGRSSKLVPKIIKGIILDPSPTAILVPKANRSTRTAGRLSFRR